MCQCAHDYNTAMIQSIGVLLFTFIFASDFIVQGQEDSKCKEPTALYDQMGCKAEGKTPENLCPTHYNCSFLESPPPNKCYHKGKLYNQLERAKNGPFDGCFAVNCICIENGEFNCAAVDCWSPRDNLKAGCHFKNEFTCCQGETMICPKTQADVQECKIDGTTYYEGQYFYPKEDTCLTCICDKGFTGKFEAPYCIPQNCSTPHYSDLKVFKENCALYFVDKTRSCCPDDNTCPTGKEIFDKSEAVVESSLHCKYGTERLPIGTKFETHLNGRRYPKSHKASCECILPPLVTCIKIKA